MHFEAAIASLEASTAAIEKQSQLLEAQKVALQALQVRNNAGSEFQNIKRDRSSKASRERAQVDFHVADLSESLQSRLQSSTKLTQSAADSIQTIAERSIEKDDRLLDGLEKLIPQIASTESRNTKLGEIGQLCHALTIQSSADVHSQLDAAYRSAAQRPGTQPNGNGLSYDKVNPSLEQSERQADSLRSELEELCREIDGLSSMVVDNKYRIPISRALQHAGEEVDTERATWSEYVTSALRYLSLRLEHMVRHFDRLHGHSSALKTINTFIEAAAKLEDPKQGTVTAGSRSPSKSASQKGLKPLRLVQAKLSDPQDPVSQVLRQFDIALSNVEDTSAFSDSVPDAVRARQVKVKLFAANSERTCQDQITLSLTKADADSKSVISAVYANSAFDNVNLTQKVLENRLLKLEEETQGLGNEIRELDIETTLRDAQRKQRTLLSALAK